jgi:uncharacterized protein (DUF1330 family)
MNSKITTILAVLAGAMLGAAGMQALHAQAKPAVYTVAEITVTNQDAYTKDYLPVVQALNKKNGAKLLAASFKVTSLTGTPPARVAINIWDSMEQLQATRSSDDFKKARAIGEKSATFREYAVEALPK